MGSYINLVQGDTKPDIIVALNDSVTWEPIDVSDPQASVVMKFSMVGSNLVQQVITASKLTGALRQDGTINTNITTPGAGGRVQFSWVPGALGVDPGNYEGEIIITFADGSVQTLFDPLLFDVRAA